MDTRPLFPNPISLPFALSVAGCFIFWLAAYWLIIRRSFKDQTFGMPIAALCGNVTWEILFSHVYKPDYRLVQYGNTAWVVLDLLILYATWKFARDDFKNPVARRWVRPMILVGILLTVMVEVPFVNSFKDTQGYFLGWADAFMMSMLFIALLLRRDNVQGQSIWIAISMFLGNVSAYFWVEYYPKVVLEHSVNLTCLLGTGFFNVAYVWLLWEKCKAQGINPWTRA